MSSVAAIVLFFNLFTWTSLAPAQEQPGRVRCAVDENGATTTARIVLARNGSTVSSGTCATALSVPAGTYSATITLDGVLDRPSRTVSVTVPSGGEAIARASFQTAILEVVFTAGGQPAFGTAILKRGGRDIGTLGSGVPVRVSAGTYQIVARYRTATRTYDVMLAAGQRRAVRAIF